MSKTTIEASSLCVSFGGQQVLNEVSFSVKSGEVFALLGGNGAGKSTALKTLLGLTENYRGRVTVLDKAVNEAIEEIRKNVAYLPESVNLYSHLTGLENLEYFLSLAEVSRSDAQISQALQRVALQREAWHRPMANYSKGMRQKVAIALALLREAPVLLLDEPTSGLDPNAIDEFNQLIATLAEQGSTIFMVTHDVYGACQVAHRIGLLDQGKIVGVFERDGQTPIDIEQVHSAFSARAKK